ncbi:MAG: hypothetical protein SPI14_06470 [Arcanobacterium sp.]|nr:hypothetical protein [Arcanobacterium sp.]
MPEHINKAARMGRKLLRLPTKVWGTATETLESIRAIRTQVDALRAQTSGIEREMRDMRSLSEFERDAAAMMHRSRYVGTPMRVVFLVHHPEAWYATQPVYEAMRDADDFEPIVATINRRFPGSGEFRDEEFVHERLNAFNVPHLRFRAHDSFEDLRALRMINPHIVFRQSQWDVDVPPAFSIWQLMDWRVCLIPYELMNLIDNPENGDGTDSAIDSAFHKNAWMIFVANEALAHKAQQGVPALAGRQFRVTGHPKADVLRSMKDAAREPECHFTVLWSAHHSIGDDWTRFGTFPHAWKVMAQLAQSHPSWHIVFSPHPALVSMLDAAQPPLSKAEVQEFWSVWKDLPNTSVIGGGGYESVFVDSDVLLTDGLSWLLEYQFMEKPVVFIEREGHRPFNEFGRRVLDGVHTIHHADEIPHVLETIKHGNTPNLVAQQRKVVDELLPIQGAAHNILNAIRTQIARENACNSPSVTHGDLN